MLGFDALGARPLGAQPNPPTGFPTAGVGVAFAFDGVAYSYPAANFVFADDSTVTGTGAATLGFTVAAVASYQPPQDVVGNGAATLDATAAAAGAHGVAGAAAASLSFSTAAAAAHGVAGAGAASLTFTPAAVATHERYELRGEVRETGVLVDRRVRVYLRSTGALVAEADTVVGAFSIHTGFAAAEHYLVPINLDAAATDWAPPVANRVLSVLAQDA